MITAVGVGIGVAYLPTQMSEQRGWQADWGAEISALGLLVVVVAAAAFVLAHIRWPQWVTGLSRLRVKVFLDPYGPDQFVVAAQDAVTASLVVVGRTVDRHPFGSSDGDPFIRITYHVFNGSRYRILLDDPVKGDLYVGKGRLLDKPIIHNGRGYWAPGATAQLRIDQRMTKAYWDELMQSSVSVGEAGTILALLNGTVHITTLADHPNSKPQTMPLVNEHVPFRLQ